MGDHAEARFGNSGDLKIYHDGSHSYVSASGTGALKLLGNNNDDVQIQPRSGYNSARFKPNGAVELYYDNSKKLETTTNGVTVTGWLQGTQVYATDYIKVSDNDKFLAGNADDLQIYHDGSHSYISDEGTGSLILTTNGTGIYLQKGNTETFAKFLADGAVELNYNDSKKFETLSTGVRAQGGIAFGSDTAAANHLDDYEIGTWTPTLIGSGSNPTQSYATQLGTYVKIGNLVHCEFDVQMSASGISAGSGFLLVGSIPFQKSNVAQTYGMPASFGYSTNLGSSNPTDAYMSQTTTYIYLMSRNSSAGSAYSQASAVENSSRVLGGFSFRTHQ